MSTRQDLAPSHAETASLIIKLDNIQHIIFQQIVYFILFSFNFDVLDCLMYADYLLCILTVS